MCPSQNNIIYNSFRSSLITGRVQTQSRILQLLHTRRTKERSWHFFIIIISLINSWKRMSNQWFTKMCVYRFVIQSKYTLLPVQPVSIAHNVRLIIIVRWLKWCTDEPVVRLLSLINVLLWMKSITVKSPVPNVYSYVVFHCCLRYMEQTNHWLEMCTYLYVLLCDVQRIRIYWSMNDWYVWKMMSGQTQDCSTIYIYSIYYRLRAYLSESPNLSYYIYTYYGYNSRRRFWDKPVLCLC